MIMVSALPLWAITDARMPHIVPWPPAAPWPLPRASRGRPGREEGDQHQCQGSGVRGWLHHCSVAWYVLQPFTYLLASVPTLYSRIVLVGAIAAVTHAVVYLHKRGKGRQVAMQGGRQRCEARHATVKALLPRRVLGSGALDSLAAKPCIQRIGVPSLQNYVEISVRLTESDSPDRFEIARL